MQGAGTALGELPPYFMARAARLSGQLDEEEEELVDLLEGAAKDEQLVGIAFCETQYFVFIRLQANVLFTVVLLQSILDRAKLGVHKLVKRVGFAGILLCASVG